MPLIKNPAYIPPKPVSLNDNYDMLLPKLNKSIPPKIGLGQADIDAWLETMNQWREKVKVTNDDLFVNWINDQKQKIAPGLDSVITPKKLEKLEQKLDELNLE